MDVFSHGLWSVALAKAVNNKKGNGTTPSRPRLRIWLAALWGVAPDVFAFAPAFTWLFIQLLSGEMQLSEWPRPEHTEPAPPDGQPIFALTSVLYSLSHSAVVFGAVFAAVVLVRRAYRFRKGARAQLPWEMLAWALHIVIDIPTHTYRFYPTPFLWPLSGWRFSGFSWAAPWFLALNYSALVLVYFLLFRKKRAAVSA
ncbi:MAG: hypothetical protein Q8R13_03100 [bacterium]|nr:hypothetical protein [bacterium]MDZ4296097.1 hypothetical protein [Patescibacteria group bacterium]